MREGGREKDRVRWRETLNLNPKPVQGNFKRECPFHQVGVREREREKERENERERVSEGGRKMERDGERL
jgi:hypothetical protein